MALGVTMLLATLASINAVGVQNGRGAWMATAAQPSRATSSGTGASTTSGVSPLWWLENTYTYDGQLIVRVDVAATGANAPVPPGIARLPRAGEFYASPALAALLRTVPADELGDRYPGTEVGVISSSAIPSPSDLVIVIGELPSVLAKAPGSGEVTAFATSSFSGGPDTLSSTGTQFVLALIALVLLFPVFIFIATATRLSAARREQRFASIRLVGATLRQVAAISAVEAGLAALLGVAIGFVLFLPLRPALAHLSLTGQAFSSADLSLHLADVVAVAVGVPLASVLSARFALRRVRISPLGVSQRATPPVPRALRLIPLFAGVAELAYFVAVGHPTSASAQVNAYFLGFILVMIGLVVAGPWLTMAGSKAMSRWATGPATLIAGRRISDNPRGAFRAISGLILALFVTSVSFGLISTLLSDHGASGADSLASRTVTDQFSGGPNANEIPSVPATMVDRLRRTEGVSGVTIVYLAPSRLKIDGAVPDINGIGGTIQYGVVVCRQLAATPALGRCRTGATYAAVGDDLSFMPFTKSVSVAAATTWPTAHPTEGITRLPVKMIAIATNGSPASIAKVQTILEAALPFDSSISQFGEFNPESAQLLSEFQSASEVIIVASLLIAGCGLAVAMAASIIERRRPFSMLRLSGTSVAVLRRVVALETALPLVVISLASAGIGLTASDLFLRSQFAITLRMPGIKYFGIIVGGLLLSLLIVASTITLLDPMTRPENARWE
jgi:hypothetical protein